MEEVYLRVAMVSQNNILSDCIFQWLRPTIRVIELSCSGKFKVLPGRIPMEVL